MSKEQMTNPGYLCLKQPLPGMARSIVELTKGKGYFKETYFTYPGEKIHYLLNSYSGP